MYAANRGAILSAAIVLTLSVISAYAPLTAAQQLTPAQGQAVDAATYRDIAADLDVKAEHYAKMARLYRVRSTGGSKQQATLHNLAWRFERLAEEHRMAAIRARRLAESKRPPAAIR